jgi:hypothetical protein
MAKQLDIPKLVKAIVAYAFKCELKSAAVFNDKRKNGRRLKFSQIKPTEEQIVILNNAFKEIKLNAVASYKEKPKSAFNYGKSDYYNGLCVFIAE